MRQKSAMSLWFALILISFVGVNPDAILGEDQPSSVEVAALLCEYKVNPIGIDELHPRLSWQLESKRRDVTSRFGFLYGPGQDGAALGPDSI